MRRVRRGEIIIEIAALMSPVWLDLAREAWATHRTTA
jgi:hypothetical protein